MVCWARFECDAVEVTLALNSKCHYKRKAGREILWAELPLVGTLLWVDLVLETGKAVWVWQWGPCQWFQPLWLPITLPQEGGLSMSNGSSPSAIQCSNSWAFVCLNFIWSWRDEIIHYFLGLEKRICFWAVGAVCVWGRSFLVTPCSVELCWLQRSSTLGCFVHPALPGAGNKDFRKRVNSMVITKWFSEITQSSARNVKMNIFQ